MKTEISANCRLVKMNRQEKKSYLFGILPIKKSVKKYFIFVYTESVSKSHPMNELAKCYDIFNLLVSQLQIHRMTKLLPFQLFGASSYTKILSLCH